MTKLLSSISALGQKEHHPSRSASGPNTMGQLVLSFLLHEIGMSVPTLFIKML